MKPLEPFALLDGGMNLTESQVKFGLSIGAIKQIAVDRKLYQLTPNRAIEEKVVAYRGRQPITEKQVSSSFGAINKFFEFCERGV